MAVIDRQVQHCLRGGMLTGAGEGVDRCWEVSDTAKACIERLKGSFPVTWLLVETLWLAQQRNDTTGIPFWQGREIGMIGNVLVPYTLARARIQRDRGLEERVWAMYAQLF